MYSAFIKNSFIQTVHIFCILVSYILLNKNTHLLPFSWNKAKLLKTNPSHRWFFLSLEFSTKYWLSPFSKRWDAKDPHHLQSPLLQPKATKISSTALLLLLNKSFMLLKQDAGRDRTGKQKTPQDKAHVKKWSFSCLSFWSDLPSFLCSVVRCNEGFLDQLWR